METKIKLKECFGDQGGKVLGGQPADECLDCDLFERCHKLTIATSLQGIAFALDFFVQNGLKSGWLKSFAELERQGHSGENHEEKSP